MKKKGKMKRKMGKKLRSFRIVILSFPVALISKSIFAKMWAHVT